MTILENDTLWYPVEHPVCEDCGQNECFGQVPNPIPEPSTKCVCIHELTAHWKGKKCRVYGCVCMKFVADEDV